MTKPKHYTDKLHIRLNPDMLELVRVLAQRHNINYSEYVRRLILNDIKANGLIDDQKT